MIRLTKLIEYFKEEVNRSQGVIQSIFLSNAQNQLIATSSQNEVQAAFLSTLFNDSIFIIRLNFQNGEDPRKDEKPLEINLTIDGKEFFLFNVKNLLLLGVVLDNKNRALGHKHTNDIFQFVSEEFENLAEWSENDVY